MDKILIQIYASKKVYSMCADKIKEEGVALKKGLIELLTYLKENNCKTILAIIE